ASVTVTAPVDGQVTLTSQTQVNHTGNGLVACSIEDGLMVSDSHLQTFQASGGFEFSNIANVRTFDIAAGQTVEYGLSCLEFNDGGIAQSRTLTAVFTADVS
ncbi:MAG: hypothetical protein AAFY28_21040, partial [Actinomycetota bacterium]